MGADKPDIREVKVKVKRPYPALTITVILFMIIVAFLLRVHFSKKNEGFSLSPQEEMKLESRLKEIDDAVQYALIANESGWYPCNHVGRTTFYLLTGEVWKYGTTTKGQMGRYSIKYLEKSNVSFVIQFRGTISECLKEEQRKLFSYPYLPENLVRPEMDRLPRPPYNSKMQ